MSAKKILFIAVLISSLVSCKNDNDKGVADKKEDLNPNIVASLELVIKQDDSLQLFYRDEAIPTYAEETSIWMPVKGSSSLQVVEFTLPDGIIPTHLRFDLGKNASKEPFVISNFMLKYMDKTFESKDSTMAVYFFANEQLKYDPSTRTLQPFAVEGQSYDPFIYSTDLLANQVKKLVK